MCCVLGFCFFFFKQKTAYELRISDWSSDVCSSDLMVEHDRLAFHTGITAIQVVVGFVLGAVLGILVGFLLGMSPAAEFMLSPYILALQIAPKVAFAPLFIIWLGYTVYPKILVAILIVFRSAERSVGKACVSTCRSRW